MSLSEHTRPVIDPEFAALLPPPTQEVLARLEMKLSVEKFRDPLVVWTGPNILLDGHTRLKLCEKYDIDYTIEYLSFPDRAAAKQWIIDNQLGRRNLTDERRAYFIGLDDLNRKQAQGGDHRSTGSNGQNVPLIGDTAEVVGEKHGVSGRTVRRDAEFAEAVDAIGASDPDTKEEILSGRSGMSKAEVVKYTPILCDWCKRVGAVAHCITCQALGDTTRPASKKKRSRRKKVVTQLELGFDVEATEMAEARATLTACLDHAESLKKEVGGLLAGC